MDIGEKQEIIFVNIVVYDWDAQGRYREIRHKVPTIDKGKHLVRRLEQAIRANSRCPGASKWLDHHYRIYGFVYRVSGVFVQTTARVS